MPSFVVHKHPLAMGKDNLVRVPNGTLFIHFDFQDRTPTVWSQKPVDDVDPRGWREWTLQVVGTGYEIVDPDIVPPLHLGTARFDWRVFHLYATKIEAVDHG